MAGLPRLFDIVNRSIRFAGMRITVDIPYGLHPRQRLDVYLPTRAASPAHVLGEPLPVIVFFYGGSWQTGHRKDYRFMAAVLAKRGFLVVVPDYRLYPEVRFPAFLQDSAAATAWTFKNIQGYGGDPKSIYLMGHSAGAYNAAMLALDAAYLGDLRLDPARLAGWIGLAGPYDFLPIRDPAIAEIFATSGDQQVTQPACQVHEGAPPALLLHGGRDRVVPPRNTAALAARLREAGAVVETRIYPGIAHAGVLLSFLPYLAWRATPLKDVLHFIQSCHDGEFTDAGSDISAPTLR